MANKTPLPRSEWRRRADDPSGLLGWWWRGFVEADFPIGVLVFALATGAIWVSVGLEVLVWAVPTLVVLLLVEWRFRLSRIPDRLAPLLADPAPAGQFRASVAYEREGTTTGCDEMALVIVDGWLIAEGVHSSFALRRQDVLNLRTGSDRQGLFPLADGSQIRLRGLSDAARIVLERWREAEDLRTARPTLPPLAVHPQEFARRGARIGVWLGSIGLLGVLVGISEVWRPTIISFLVMGVCLLNRSVGRLRQLSKMQAKVRASTSANAPRAEVPGRTLEGGQDEDLALVAE